MHLLSFWESFVINTFAVFVHTLMKNPAKYQTIESNLQEIANDILTAFPPDATAVKAA